MQWLAMQFRAFDLAIPLKFPRENSSEIFIVTLRFAIGRLMFLAKMTAAGFVPLEGIDAHEFSEFEEISNAPGAFERLIVGFALAGNAHLFPKFISEFRNLPERFPQTGRIPRHAAFVPKQQPKLTMK